MTCNSTLLPLDSLIYTSNACKAMKMPVCTNKNSVKEILIRRKREMWEVNVCKIGWGYEVNRIYSRVY